MTEQELNVFLDLEWNCAAFTPDTEHISAPLSPKQWARIISRHPELQEFCPFSEFTPNEWTTVLENSHRLHGGVHAGGISLRINGRICCDTNRLCSIIAKYRITPLYGAGYWQVTVISVQILIRMTSLCATGSGSSSTTHGFGITVHAKTSSQNQCGGAFFSVPQSC